MSHFSNLRLDRMAGKFFMKFSGIFFEADLRNVAAKTYYF